MVNGIRTLYSCELNKGFNLKHWKYNNKDERSCLNTLSDKKILYLCTEMNKLSK